MNTPTTPLGVALLRATIGGLILGAYTGLTAYAASDGKTALIVGAIAGLGYLMQRGGFEGLSDKMRDEKQPPEIQPGDVGVPGAGDVGGAAARRPNVYDVNGDGKPDL